jgi:hypothetical protein
VCRFICFNTGVFAWDMQGLKFVNWLEVSTFQMPSSLDFLETIVLIFCYHFQVAEQYCVLRNFINYPYSMILGWIVVMRCEHTPNLFSTVFSMNVDIISVGFRTASWSCVCVLPHKVTSVTWSSSVHFYLLIYFVCSLVA